MICRTDLVRDVEQLPDLGLDSALERLVDPVDDRYPVELQRPRGVERSWSVGQLAADASMWIFCQAVLMSSVASSYE